MYIMLKIIIAQHHKNGKRIKLCNGSAEVTFNRIFADALRDRSLLPPFNLQKK